MPRKDAAAAPEDVTTDALPSGETQTAAQWAVQPRTWLASGVDVVRGYSQRLDLIAITIRLTVFALGIYSVYLAYCESCKDEYYALARSMKMAVEDALNGTRGSAAGEALVLGVMVWLLTVLWMRQRAAVYLVEFKTYRHKIAGGAEQNTAGEPVEYDKFLDVSRTALHPDGSSCFNAKSMEFQEKIIRTSCIGEMSIFPPAIFSEDSIASGKEAERDYLCMKGAREEAELMMFRAVEELLVSTKTRPEDVDILIVNCELPASPRISPHLPASPRISPLRWPLPLLPPCQRTRFAPASHPLRTRFAPASHPLRTRFALSGRLTLSHRHS